jgi:hypothetical protein
MAKLDDEPLDDESLSMTNSMTDISSTHSNTHDDNPPTLMMAILQYP